MSIRKVVDKTSDKVLFIGTYKQAVDYCIHNNLGKFYEFIWEDHVIDGGDQDRNKGAQAMRVGAFIAGADRKDAGSTTRGYRGVFHQDRRNH